MENPLTQFKYCPRCGTDGFADYAGRAKKCNACGLTYFHNVAAAVACLVRDREGRYLFVRRAKEPAKGTLDLAGGFVDPMETIEEAVRREIQEETRLDVKRMHYIGSRPNRYPFSGVLVYTADQFFLAEVDSFEGAIAQDDAAELVIARFEDLKAEDFGLESICGFMSELLANPQALLPQ